MSANLKNAIRAINKTALLYGSVSTLALAGMAGVANAQDESLQTEEVLVTGIRASLESSLNIKRTSNAVVDAITAEDIGNFPDKNVADSLARLPGVAIDRDFGEGQGVTIRGVSPDQNLTLLNGQAVGTAQWFVLSNATRNFNFEILASEMVGALEVYKSAQADMDEGGLGGTVILRTRKPLDLDANTFNASVDAQYGSNAEEWDPSISGLYSWKTADERLGILFSVAHQQRTVERHTMEDFGWFGPSIPRIAPLMGGPTLEGGGNDDVGAIPWGMGSALFSQERERTGFDVTAQFAPTDELDMTLHYLSSEMEADNVNSNLIGIGFRGVAYMGTDTDIGTTNDNNIVDYLEVRGKASRPAWSNHMAYDNIFRNGSEMSTEVIDFEGNFETGVHRVHWQLGQTTGEGVNKDFFTEFWGSAVDPRVAFDFYNPGGTTPYIDFVTPSPWLTSPTDEMWLGGIFDQVNATEDQENYVQVDYDFEVDLGSVRELSFGAKLRDRSFNQTRDQQTLANLAATGANSLGPASDFWSGDLITVDHSATAGRGSQTYFMPDRALMYAEFYGQPSCDDPTTAAANAAIAAANAANAPTDPDQPLITCLNTNAFQPLSSFNVEEQINAVYAMATFEEGGLRGNVGLRYVTTDQESSGYNADGSEQTPFKSDYAVWLPSLNVAYDLSEEVVMRFAAGRALTRPAPFQLAPAVNLTPETGRGSAGNPNLNPLTADQYELGLEWYYDDASNVSVTAFKKDITDFIFNQTVDGGIINGSAIPQLTRPENGGSSTIEGAEFQVTHAWDMGVGVFANYTYTDVGDAEIQSATALTGPDDDDSDDAAEITGATLTSRFVQFPNASQNTYNLGVYYENDSLSARLNYNYRSEYFLAQTEIGNQMRDEQSQWDAQFSYYITDNISVQFEAINLTDEVIENYYVRESDGARLGGSSFANGRRFFLGANYKF
jgi:iron complex outermembrane receptor protein